MAINDIMNTAKHGVKVEQSLKHPDKWRVVSRSVVSGRVLKVWFDGKDLETADTLAEGIMRGLKND